MGIPSFFKLPKPRKFDYKPLYYDPVKERRQERNRQIERELGLDKDKKYVSRIYHGIFRDQIKRNLKTERSSNIRLIIIFIILLLLAYLIFYR